MAEARGLTGRYDKHKSQVITNKTGNALTGALSDHFQQITNFTIFNLIADTQIIQFFLHRINPLPVLGFPFNRGRRPEVVPAQRTKIIFQVFFRQLGTTFLTTDTLRLERQYGTILQELFQLSASFFISSVASASP